MEVENKKKKIHDANNKHKKLRIILLISDEMDFRTKNKGYQNYGRTLHNDKKKVKTYERTKNQICICT